MTERRRSRVWRARSLPVGYQFGDAGKHLHVPSAADETICAERGGWPDDPAHIQHWNTIEITEH